MTTKKIVPENGGAIIPDNLTWGIGRSNRGEISDFSRMISLVNELDANVHEKPDSINAELFTTLKRFQKIGDRLDDYAQQRIDEGRETGELRGGYKWLTGLVNEKLEEHGLLDYVDAKVKAASAALDPFGNPEVAGVDSYEYAVVFLAALNGVYEGARIPTEEKHTEMGEAYLAAYPIITLDEATRNVFDVSPNATDVTEN